MMKIPIIFENAEILIANKPAGIPCHGRNGADDSDSLLSVLFQGYPEVSSEFPDEIDGGLCHRLDNDTSGLLIVARNKEAKKKYRQMLVDSKIEKVYRALVVGNLKEKLHLNGPIAHHPKSKKKMVVVDQKGTRHRGEPRPALSIVRSINQEERNTRVEVRLVGPGARHQIRVHLAKAGFPLVGDIIYGKSNPQAPSGNKTKHLLHAHRLVIPGLGTFEAKEPF